MSLRTQMRELQKKIKARTEVRRKVIYWDIVRDVFANCESPSNGTVTRGRDGCQIFLVGIQFDDNQKRLDKIHEVVRRIKKHFGDSLIRIDYRYGARTKWVHHVGPNTDTLIEKVDGDRNYVVLSIRLIDPDY